MLDMLTYIRLPNTVSRHLYRRTIALVLLLVMVVLAVPACCYELALEQEGSCLSQGPEAVDTEHDSCPCCPDRDNTGTDTDNCSTCSYCSFYVPLTATPSSNYSPSVTQLTGREPFTKMPEVHISIFVPPQNRA